MIPATELAALQAAANTLLDLTCTIQHVTSTADGYGATTEALSTATTVACLVAKPTAAQMRAYADLIGDLEAWIVTLPAGTDVRVNDVLTVSGETLKVQIVFTPLSYSVLNACLASEVR